MKKILHLTLSVLLIMFFSCGEGTKSGSTNDLNAEQNKMDSIGFELDSLEISKLKKVYSLNLALYRENKLLRGYLEAADSSLVVAAFNFGDTIPLLEDLKNGWLAVYANLGQRRYDSSLGKAYIKKSDLGDIKNLMLEEKDFSVGIEFEDSIHFVTPKTLSIELISQRKFEDKLKLYKSPLENIKHGVKQENETLSLITGNGIINLKDKDPIKDSTLHDDQVIKYSYIGFNNALNAHVIKHNEWESSGYDLYSQATGEIVATTNAHPQFSIDNKYLVDIAHDPYERVSVFCLQTKNDKGKYEPLLTFNFLKWSPVSTSNEKSPSYFWDKDGNIYVKTIVLEGVGTALEDIDNIIQYIKIKPE